MKAKSRGQLSLELLVIFSIFLALLLISLASLSKISAMWDERLSLAAAELALDNLADAADEVCVLGEGNTRLVSLPGSGYSLSAEGSSLTANYKGRSASRKTRCPVEAGEIGKGKAALVENKGTSVRISPFG